MVLGGWCLVPRENAPAVLACTWKIPLLLGVLVALHADRLARALAGAGVGGGALAADRKAATVADATVAVNRL